MRCVHFSQHTIYKYSKRRRCEHTGHSATVVYDKRACRRMPAGPRKRSRRGLLGKVDFAPLVGSQDAQGMDREILELRIYHVCCSTWNRGSQATSFASFCSASSYCCKRCVGLRLESAWCNSSWTACWAAASLVVFWP